MYLYMTKHGSEMQGDGFFQPKFDEDKVAQADRLEIWATNFEDNGEYCDFRLMQGDTVIASKTIQGY